MRALQTVCRHLEDPGAVFVFPSEIAVRFWARKALELSGKKALDLRRFISWDRFKETSFKFPPGGRAANQAVRALFAHALLEENSRQGFLRRIVPPEFRESSAAFAGFLGRILPSLHRLRRLDAAGFRLDADKAEDLRLLERRYGEFLAQNNLFEPSFEPPLLELPEKSFFLFYPEVLEDYPSYRSLISSHPRVRLLGLDDEAGAQEPTLTLFENSLQEIRWALLSIGELLDGGLGPEDIAVSVCDLSALEAFLKREADCYSVPLQIHSGRFLDLYPEVRAFRQIGECVEASFTPESLKPLLLNPALPWKDPAQLRSLLHFGLEAMILRNPLPRGGGADLWERSFQKAEACGGASGPSLQPFRSLYRKLKEQLALIRGAADFLCLKERIAIFSETFLDSSRWGQEGLKVFQYALRTLDELAEAWAASGKPDLASPFSLWLEFLGQKIYVPRALEGGVPVYPYRLAAGIYPRIHFVLNASQEGTSHRIRLHPFLAVHEEADPALGELDLSPLVIRLTLLSGQEVRFSYSRKSFSDTHLPPAYFVSRGRILPFSALEELESRDSYLAERLAWSGGCLPLRLQALQKQGFLCAQKTILSPPGEDATLQPLREPALAERLLRERCAVEALLDISASDLELFHSCPFHYLLARVLGLEEREFQIPSLEAKELGNILHRVLQRFFEALREQGGTLRADEPAASRKRMEETARAVLEEYARCRPLPLPPHWEDICRQVRELTTLCLQRELEELPGQQILHSEKWLSSPWPQEGLRLKGKIDRISRSPEGYTLIDYKKNKVPTRRQTFGPQPSCFQMPFYLLLMGENGLPAHQAAYYSLEKARFTFVIGPQPRPQASAEELQGCLESLKARILSMAASLRQGEYMIPKRPDPKRCEFCPFRAACRDRYILRP